MHRPPGKGFPPDRLQRPLRAVPDSDRPSIAATFASAAMRSCGDAELVLQLTRRHSVGMGYHEMRCPEPCRQRQLGAMHRRPRRDRGLPAAIETFMQTRSAFQPNRAALAAARTYKTIRPAPLE